MNPLFNAAILLRANEEQRYSNWAFRQKEREAKKYIVDKRSSRDFPQRIAEEDRLENIVGENLLMEKQKIDPTAKKENVNDITATIDDVILASDITDCVMREQLSALSKRIEKLEKANTANPTAA